MGQAIVQCSVVIGESIVRILRSAWLGFACVCAGISLATAAPPESLYTISFASFAPVNSDVFIADGRGNDARVLFPSPALDYDAIFAPQGDWIYFTSTRDGSADIFRARPDGSQLESIVAGPAYDDQAAISLKGDQLAFVSSRSGQADIWLLNLRTGRLTNISRHPAGDFRPAWSPDGQWLAFSSDRDSKKPLSRSGFALVHSTEIYLMRPDGSDTRRLTQLDAVAGSPRWSSDGKTIVFSFSSIDETFKITTPQRLLGTSQIQSVNVSTGAITTLTTGPGEKRSSQYLSAARVGYVVESQNSGLEFTDGSSGARGEFKNPTWSSDGKHMLFHRDVEPSWPPHRPWTSLDSRFRLLRTGVFSSWSPDGKRMISNDQTAGILRNSILVMDADGAHRSVIYTHPEQSALAPAWSPRGDQIAFALGQFFQTIKGPAQADIVTMRLDGGELRTLTAGKSNYGFPSWSGDGQRLVYREVFSGRNSLHILELSSGAHRVLIESDHHLNFPAWSPIAEVIAFTSDNDGDYEIYSINADGTNLQRLTHSPGNDAHCAWSRDGEWIAFASGRGGFKDEASLYKANPQSYGEIFVMRADGSEQHPLTDDQFEEATPAWRPPEARISE